MTRIGASSDPSHCIGSLAVRNSWLPLQMVQAQLLTPHHPCAVHVWHLGDFPTLPDVVMRGLCGGGVVSEQNPTLHAHMLFHMQ